MGDIVTQRDIGSLIDVKSLSTLLSWTAGGGADSATFTGTVIDREAFATGSLPNTVDVGVWYSATLGSGHTLSLQFDLQDSADNSAFSDYATEAAAVIATGPSGGGVVTGIARMAVANTNAPSGHPSVDVRGARRYLRPMVIPHLSATGTDTAQIVAIGVFAGFDFLAAPAT